MNYEIIAQIILVFSLIGLLIIIFRKIPTLVELPAVIPSEGGKMGEKIKNRFRTLNPLKSFSHEMFLHKVISKVRILTLKTDTKTFNWLQKLRQNSQKNKLKENEKYWDEIKNSNK